MKRAVPLALRKLLRKIKITTSMIEGGVSSISAREIPESYQWTSNPTNLLQNDGTNSRFILLLCDEDVRVYAQYCDKDTKLTKKLITDASEYISVSLGRLLDNVTGTIIEPGKDMYVPVGQVHEFIALEHSIFTVTFKFVN